MMKIIDITIHTVIGSAAALIISSCAYDPISYTSTSGTYSSSTGRTSTSVFISTGNPRWGYDPYSRSYYDYTRSCYYDPYLNGYYPRGYRPTIVVGAPHPHGWSPGRKVCPPPRSVRNINIHNYRQRDVAYRNSGHSWAKKVHVKSNNGHRWTPPSNRSRSSWESRVSSRSNRNDHRSNTNGSNHAYRSSNQPSTRSYEPQNRVQGSSNFHRGDSSRFNNPEQSANQNRSSNRTQPPSSRNSSLNNSSSRSTPNGGSNSNSRSIPPPTKATTSSNPNANRSITSIPKESKKSKEKR